MAWSEPEELFRGYDADGQLVKVWSQDSVFHTGQQDVVIEAGEHPAMRLARVTEGFLTELAACLKRGA